MDIYPLGKVYLEPGQVSRGRHMHIPSVDLSIYLIYYHLKKGHFNVDILLR